jgi:hypothetical protein
VNQTGTPELLPFSAVNTTAVIPRSAIKKSGISVTLDEAELVMSCFSPSDRYNEIHVQIINPLTEQKADMAIEVKNIESITF